MKVQFRKLHPEAQVPQYQTTGSAGIDTCKRQALRLLLDEATDIVQTIRIGMELDKLKPAPAAHSERSAQADGKTAPGAGTQ